MDERYFSHILNSVLLGLVICGCGNLPKPKGQTESPPIPTLGFKRIQGECSSIGSLPLVCHFQYELRFKVDCKSSSMGDLEMISPLRYRELTVEVAHGKKIESKNISTDGEGFWQATFPRDFEVIPGKIRIKSTKETIELRSESFEGQIFFGDKSCQEIRK